LCLFASHGFDLRSLVREGYSDADLASAIGHIWAGRTDRYSELRAAQDATSTSSSDTTAPRRVEMSYIGG
jgi:cyclic pyranopterin phosphate synthase